ncbi:hypothetical protein Tco_1233656 [Tanacetum coccineum]
MYPPKTSESSVGDSSSKSSAGPSRKRCRSPAATVTSFVFATRALVPSRADVLPHCKRFRDSISPEDSVEEDIDTDVLEDIEATDATAVKVAVDRDVEARLMQVSTASTKLSTASVSLYFQKKVNIAKDLRLPKEDLRIKTYEKIYIDVIENGNSWISVLQTSQENGTSVTKMSVHVTAEEKINKKNYIKARSLLLMALPNKHQLTFSQYSDAKTMYAAIKTQFGGNEATKKTQKSLLKQQYENFNASSSESLDSIFNRFQKLVSRLAILGVVITPEDLNSKFLRSLPPEWNTNVVVWMNKCHTP